MSTLTLRQLQYFLAVAELRHFGKAAEKCCVTQPALSTQIRELESALGIQLVDRRRGRLGLTAEGRDMAHHAQAILTAVREMQESARGLTRRPAGTLRLGVIPSLAPYFLPPLLPELKAAYPDLRIEIYEHVTERLVAGLFEGTLDTIVTALPMQQKHVESMLLFEERFLLARRRTANGRPPPTAAETLRTETLLLLDDAHATCNQVLNDCRRAMSEFGASSLPTIMRMVASGYGVTLLPEIAADAEAADSRIDLVPLEPEPRRKVGLGWRNTSARKREFRAIGMLMARKLSPVRRREGLPLEINATLSASAKLANAGATSGKDAHRDRSLCEG